MHERPQQASIEDWLDVVRSRFERTAPALVPFFDTYAAEATFGRNYIRDDLARLRPKAKILEVGAGSLLLSCQLAREVFDVTALEPVGEGFSHFDQMRELVLSEANSRGCSPRILGQAAEALDAVDCFDYAFSVNVMEHVNDVASVIEKVGKSLAGGAGYRFTCPNYLFPYEPHFNMPTLFSKRLTERMLGRMIFASRNVTDPSGTWKSLNWINVVQIKRVVRGVSGLRVVFNRSMFPSTLERIASDTEFAGRRSPTIRGLILLLVRLRLHFLFGLIPAALQPIIDCRIEKSAELEAR